MLAPFSSRRRTICMLPEIWMCLKYCHLESNMMASWHWQLELLKKTVKCRAVFPKSSTSLTMAPFWMRILAISVLSTNGLKSWTEVAKHFTDQCKIISVLFKRKWINTLESCKVKGRAISKAFRIYIKSFVNNERYSVYVTWMKTGQKFRKCVHNRNIIMSHFIPINRNTEPLSMASSIRFKSPKSSKLFKQYFNSVSTPNSSPVNESMIWIFVRKRNGQQTMFAKHIFLWLEKWARNTHLFRRRFEALQSSFVA